MGSRKHKWRISFYRSSANNYSKPENCRKPPNEFICPISRSLMADPVIVSSGQTFERNCVLACKTLNFTPILPDGCKPDFSAVIPNLALKSTILNWVTANLDSSPPKPFELSSALKLVRGLMAEDGGRGNLELEKDRKNGVAVSEDKKSGVMDSEYMKNGVLVSEDKKNGVLVSEDKKNGVLVSEDKKNGVLVSEDKKNGVLVPEHNNDGILVSEHKNNGVLASENNKSGVVVSEELLIRQVKSSPDINIGHADSALARRRNRFDSDESFGNSGRMTPLLQLATRPSCYSSPSSSSEIEVHTCEEEEEYVGKLRSPHVHDQEEGVVALRRTTRTGVESRVGLCTPRILLALRSLIISKYANIQVNAVAALVNLSLEKINKVKIVRAGIVPPLIDVLKGGFPEAQEHASGALFSLALADENKTAIGVLGALPPLLHMLRSDSERACHDAALALYHLSLIQSNRSKLVKLGSVQVFLGMVRSGHMTGRILLILCNLGACGEGRAAMLDAGAVECFVGMLRGGDFDSESNHESCVAALCALSQGGLRFKGLAKLAGAVEVLKNVVEESGSERAREKARRVLETFKAREEEEEEDVDWEKVLEAGFPSRTISRPAGPSGTNSTEF